MTTDDAAREVRRITGAQTIGDPTVLRTFRVRTIVDEVVRDDRGNEHYGDEPLASIGTTVDAENFSGALPGFDHALNKQWGQVAAMASVIDMEPAPLPPYAPTDDTTTSDTNSGGFFKKFFAGRKGK